MARENPMATYKVVTKCGDGIDITVITTNEQTFNGIAGSLNHEHLAFLIIGKKAFNKTEIITVEQID